MLRFVKRELFWEVLQTNKMLLLLTLETLQTFLDSMYEKLKKINSIIITQAIYIICLIPSSYEMSLSK